MREPFVGLYWTLPVTWAGYRDLPPSVDAAALASKTIRYQRERVRRYVFDMAGDLVDEIAFMDTRTDRATDAVRDVLRRNAPAFHASRPTLLTVWFEQTNNWRRNPFLLRAAAELGLNLIGLSPDALVIDGIVFDPSRHFAAWRKRNGTATDRLRLAAEDGLQKALVAVPDGTGRWRAIATSLNERGIATSRGCAWTSEGVRKAAGRLPCAHTDVRA